jgi:predicted metal-dependent hydrolase
MVQKQITFQNQILPYCLKVSSRAKRMRLSVACDASVTLTLPRGMDLSVAEKFLQSKLNWIVKTLEKFKPFKNRITIKSGKKEYLKYKPQALNLAKAKVNEWNQVYNFKYRSIKIKNQKTRWGSCSRKGNLNFNYKIVFLPEDQLNYLVVHELCHLKEFNHSPAFWRLVAQTIPNYRHLRKLLHTW